MSKKVYCEECRYLIGKKLWKGSGVYYQCSHPENKVSEDWDFYRRSTKDLNQYNNCPWFEAKS